MTTQPHPTPKPVICPVCLKDTLKPYGAEGLCFGCWRETMGAKKGHD